MWKKDNEPQPAAAPQAAPTAAPPRAASSGSSGQAIIGPSIRVKGNLQGKEDLLIQGTVEGKVELQQNQVTVGPQGKVKADIMGRVIVVQGSVEGNLFGSEQVLLSSSSSVRGNITAPRVSLDDGANFKGAIDMSSGASATASKPGAQPGPKEHKGGGGPGAGGQAKAGQERGGKPGGKPHGGPNPAHGQAGGRG